MAKLNKKNWEFTKGGKTNKKEWERVIEEEEKLFVGAFIGVPLFTLIIWGVIFYTLLEGGILKI